MQTDPEILRIENNPSDWRNPARETRVEDPTTLDHVATVPVSSLLPGNSPRIAGENAEHVQALAAAQDLPPILVHRTSMRVIDGMHRLRAAQLRGDDTICVKFFEGDHEKAFLLAVNANIKHGLPLSLADREAAAARILATHQEWSDRAIATAAGLSPTTVSAIRQRCSTDQCGQSNSRVGRDRRVRPINGSAGRRRASEVIARKPDASLRTIAREAGVSVATARDVRERLHTGQDPVLASQREADATEHRPTATRQPPAAGLPGAPHLGNAPAVTDWRSIRANLSKDPTVKYAENGRAFVRWIDTHLVESIECRSLIQAVPPHWRDDVAEVARLCARTWLEFAKELERTKGTNIK